jgi:long-chain acyl-CoA synthetase
MISLPLTLTRAAQTNPNGIATICKDRQHTWTELKDRVARLAAGLQQQGLAEGGSVAMLALNSDRYYEFMFAAPRAGGVFVPLTTRLAVPEIVYWLTDSETEVLFIDDAFLPMLDAIKADVPKLKCCIYTGDGETPEGLVNHEDLIANNAAVDASPRCETDLVGLFYTGGTTGRSKGVMLSHRNILANSMQSLTVMHFDADDVYLHAAPMFHIADGFLAVAMALLGITNVFIPGFEPQATLDAMKEHKVTRVLLVPTMINMLINFPAAQDYDFSRLKSVLYGASPMPEAVIKQAMELMPTTGFTQAYGQTEAAPVLTLLTPAYHCLEGPKAGKLKAAGQPVPGVTLAILDHNDQPVPNGTVGEVCARGMNVMLGYKGMEEATTSTLANGWLHTGDGGYLDDDGFLFIVDRVKDMIVSGGENVYSVEVENAIYKHQAVAECAVIGIPSEQWGEQVHAIVRLKDGESLDEAGLMAHCKALIAGFKCPRSVEFKADPLPVSGAGKILKKDLRAPYWDGQDRSVN